MDMTKFISADDPGFLAICGELRRWIKEIGAMKKHRENASRGKAIDRGGSEDEGESSSTRGKKKHSRQPWRELKRQ
jgi:protein SERAC1